LFDSNTIETLVDGILVTLRITALAGLVGTVVAVVSGLAGLSPLRPVRWVNRIYVEVFRGTSAIIQLFWAFFALPLLGIELAPTETAVYALGLNMGAYGSEVVRGAVVSVPRGQYEAAIALSVAPWKRMAWIVFPQAIPSMLPPYGNLAIEVLKATALVGFITAPDFFLEGQKLRNAGAISTQELYLTMLIGYFVIAQAIAAGVRVAEGMATRGLEGRG
jgi:polar amino acid transport system permease protein